MAKTDPLDPNVPASTESPRMGDDRIRALARAVAELLNVDHYMGYDGGPGTGYNENAAGEHKQVKFNAPIPTPTNEANKMFVYGKDVNGKIELHCLDEDGNEIQLTNAGKLYSASGFTMPSGQTATIEIIQAVDSTGILLKNDGGDTVVTVGDDGTATLAVGSQLASSTAPAVDADIANKKYVDDQIVAEVPVLSRTKGWAYVNSSGTVIVSYNVTNASKNGTGDYSVNWNIDFSSSNYCVAVTPVASSGRLSCSVYSLTAGTARIRTFETYTGTNQDYGFHIVAFGEQ